MALPVVSPRSYQRITLVAAWSLAAIIVTGAVVRLSGSGLGCPDWPTCDKDRLVAPLSWHPMVEFVNRTITGLVSVLVILAVLGSLRRVPYRRDLVWLSVSLVAGVIGQIVLGGVTVLTDLNPVAVQSHFVLSMVILAAAVVLNRRAGEEPPYQPTVVAPLRHTAWAVTALTGVAICTGTVVTGTGPHGGDENAHRFGFAITSVARIHSGAVILAVATALVLVYQARRRQRDWDGARRSAGAVPVAGGAAGRRRLHPVLQQRARWSGGCPHRRCGLGVGGRHAADVGHPPRRCDQSTAADQAAGAMLPCLALIISTRMRLNRTGSRRSDRSLSPDSSFADSMRIVA